MPCKKSVSRLKGLCLERLKGSIQDVTFQDKIEKLPYVLINELFRSFGNAISSSRPLTVFVHAKVKKLILNNWNCKDLIAYNLLLDKVGDVCKHLRKLTVWHSFNEAETRFLPTMQVSINNLHLRHLELYGTSCTDSELKFIGTHCSHLEYLSLKYCLYITNHGISYLCTHTAGESRNLKIQTLNLVATSVTPEGCLVALRNLPVIKTLKPADTNGICEMLAQELERSKTLPEVENLPVDWEWNDIDVAISVMKALPKLRKLHVHHGGLDIHELLPHVTVNLTSLKVTGYYVSIEVIDRCFPLLRKLKIRCGGDIFDIDEQVSTKNVSFKHLRKLTLDMYNEIMFTNGHYKMLFANCQALEKLRLESIDMRTDHLLSNILQWNPLSKLKEIILMWCFVSCAQLRKLLELNALSSIKIEEGIEDYEEGKFDDIRNYIDEFNLDVEFSI